jgi:hypothetical protein
MEYKMHDDRKIVHSCKWERETVQRDDQYEGWLHVEMRCGKKLKFHQNHKNRLTDAPVNCLGCI